MLGEVMQTLAKPVKQQGQGFAVELQMLNPYQRDEEWLPNIDKVNRPSHIILWFGQRLRHGLHTGRDQLCFVRSRL
ncbi:hypothetical protein D3C87_1290790 [compost metagenome]